MYLLNKSIMKTLYFNKYTNWTKDLTYKESIRDNLSYYTIREVSETEYTRIVNMTIEEVKSLIDSII